MGYHHLMTAVTQVTVQTWALGVMIWVQTGTQDDNLVLQSWEVDASPSFQTQG